MSDKLLRRLLEAAHSYTTTRQYYSRSQASEDLDRREQAFIAVIRETEAALREAPSSETEVTAYRRMADAAQSGASPEDVVAAQFVPSATEATRHGMSEPDYLEWLADKLPALGDYAKEAAQVLRRIAAEKRTPSPAAAPDYEKLYHELLFAVGKKYPGETRHHTALRYILNAERGSNQAQASAQPQAEEKKA